MAKTKVQEILDNGTLKEQRSLFSFDSTDSDEAVLLKFNLWGRFLFIKYFKSPDANVHEEINWNNLQLYRGKIDAFVDIAFRGAGKDVKTKLFIAFCILNDLEHRRRFFKVLSEDGANSKQSVTDIYNMLVNVAVTQMYPEVFEKTLAKREERMSAFTTSTGVKVIADTVGVDQRGAIQEEARPDFIWFNDFETRKTLRSARETKSIWENMEEARTGLEKGGGCVYTCNYVSEQGNVHRLVTEKLSDRKKILIVPIWDDEENITWLERYTRTEILQMIEDDDDFEGERLCKPSASKDIYFDRESLETMEVQKIPARTVSDFKMFTLYDPSHRYGAGHDVAGGVGLDSSTSVFIDFDVIPCRVVATYKCNTIKEDVFGSEIKRQGDYYGECLVAPEQNNHGHATIAILKKEYDNRKIYGKEKKDTHMADGTVPKEFGWHTNAATKPKMFAALRKAIEDGLLELTDADLIAEAKSYTRNDLMETNPDPRLISPTKHFDLLTACAIAWQMKDYAEVRKETVQAIKQQFAKNKFKSVMNSTK